MSEAESEPSLLSCIRIRKIARSAPAVLRAERACQFLVASLNPPAVDAIPDQSILASNLYQELAPVSRHRYILLQREIEQRLAGYLHLVSLRYYLRPGSDTCANPAPIAAPLPPPARAPMIDPTAAPPTVLFAVLAPRDLPVNSYSPVTIGTICPFTTIPVSSSRSSDLPVNVPDFFDSSNRPYTSAFLGTTTLPSAISGSSSEV